MDVGTAMSVVQTLLTALQCSDQIIKFCSVFGYKPQLEQLEKTVDRIRAKLVEANQELSLEEKAYVDQLKEVLYEADDLVDEFLTLARRKELTKSFMDRHFSLLKKPGFALRMSRKVNKIQKKLDGIASNNQLIRSNSVKYNFKEISRESFSYVPADKIIGREVDLDNIVVGKLLQSDVQQDVSFLSIVGIGGLGKTALAQLVFNDPRVTDAFPLKLWSCVSDLGQDNLDIEGILRKILASITGVKNEGLARDRVLNDLRAKLKENKFLLILDDVWTENHFQWSNLTSFLTEGGRGSWILVTTRSQETARILGTGSMMYELQGLSDEDSWRLFVVNAFGCEQSNLPTDLLDIGKEIVARCANVPLAIRVMGSLLYRQEQSQWRLIRDHGLTKMEENKNDIMPILKLSYLQLDYSLKSCFVYCALFPKDYVMKKKTLMNLWMAQGYVSSDGQLKMEDVAEHYFKLLLRRCFLQDVVKDEFGDIVSCKLHDLMHDVAQEVSEKDICVNDSISGELDEEVRHIHLTSSQSMENSFTKFNVCSCLQGNVYEDLKRDEHSLDKLVANNWKYLRVLGLIELDNIKSLPKSIGGLLHLRYLDLSYNVKLELLPRQITKLYNLQTLLLRSCFHLKELPKNMRKLVKLRVLDIKGCDELSNMPMGIGTLECLEELPVFVVGEASSSLEELKALRQLKGDLEVKIGFWKKDVNMEKDGGGGYLQNKEHLNHLCFRFKRDHGRYTLGNTVFEEELAACEKNGVGRVENDEAVIKELQPHSNVKRLDVICYHGVRIPEWQQVNLANLVNLEFIECYNLKSLGCLGKLLHLKYLLLDGLGNLEYLIENNTELGSSSGAQDFSVFPSLESLRLTYLPKLQGWWRGVGMGDNNQSLRLLQLKTLELRSCKELTAIVECLTLEELEVNNVNENLRIIINNGTEKVGDPNTSASSNVPSSSKLRKVDIDNMKWLISLQQMEAFHCLHSLKIWEDQAESFGEGNLLRSCSSSLQILEIFSCWNLKSLSGELLHLTALETLSIIYCSNLRLPEVEEDRGDGSGMTGRSINQCLRTLKLCQLPLLVNLPNWMQNLTALQTLDIRHCRELKSLPSWMSNLTSLRKLCLTGSSEALKERCKRSTGEDWPHIKHIPSIET